MVFRGGKKGQQKREEGGINQHPEKNERGLGVIDAVEGEKGSSKKKSPEGGGTDGAYRAEKKRNAFLKKKKNPHLGEKVEWAMVRSLEGTPGGTTAQIRNLIPTETKKNPDSVGKKKERWDFDFHTSGGRRI